MDILGDSQSEFLFREPFHATAADSCQYAEAATPFSMVVIAASLLRTLRTDSTRIGPWMDALTEGYERGRRSGFLTGFPWEELWEAKLEQLRAEARIPPRLKATG